MAKYDSLLSPVTNLLPNSQAILIALSNNPSVDALASGLALYLSLQQTGKNVSIVSEGTLLVSHSNLFGVGDIKNQLPQNGTGGNFTLTLGGVVGADNKPVLEGVNYSIQGSDLKLVFPVTPGKRYEPTFITPKFEGGNFDLIITVGVSALDQLGNIFAANTQLFNSGQLINIDNSQNNSQFGAVKVLDPQASSVSEMVLSILSGLNLPIDRDIASNLLSGISEQNQSMDTSLQQPIQIPAATPPPAGGSPAQPIPQVPESTQPQTGTFDISQLYKPNPISDQSNIPQIPSTHEFERTHEESASGNEVEEVVTPEEDWLTPKIYSGKSIG